MSEERRERSKSRVDGRNVRRHHPCLTPENATIQVCRQHPPEHDEGGASKMRANHSPGLCSDCSIRNRTLPLLYVNKGGAEGNSIPITQTLRNRVCVGSSATEFVQLYAPVARPNQSAYAHSCR